ncbi:MAG TPA: HAMP domain-containing sensor histidine kinase, partial [Desulfuromonadales bacterium]|nr:HAMP domain-containing sensor histidine kinase [Desulfuromonadales bacterium]
GAVVGYLELIKDEPDSAKAARIVESTQEELGRIDRLVRDLLDYAAPGNEEPEELDPGEVISDARRLLEEQGVFESVQLEDDLPDVLPSAFLPRHKLLQVFVNLLLNARDACAGQGVVRISADAADDDVRLSISDTGHGMSEETARHIFDPFYTTKDPGKGRGLGLSVCHRIVDEAGGRIEVVSREGEGSTFTVYLPISGGN